MAKPKTRKKRAPKRVLALPDLEHAKTAVLNSLTSSSGQRTYDHAIREFVSWYCSEPRPSVDGSKPAIDRHFKTGHHERGGRFSGVDQWPDLGVHRGLCRPNLPPLHLLITCFRPASWRLSPSKCGFLLRTATRSRKSG
jgi:hypothetical protein